MKDYWDIASQAFPAISRHAHAHSAGLLESLRLGADIKGFFKPLTATAKTANGTQAVLNPMVGCQVTLEGIGVQWAGAQVCAAMECFDHLFCLSLSAWFCSRRKRVVHCFLFPTVSGLSICFFPCTTIHVRRSVWLRAARFWCLCYLRSDRIRVLGTIDRVVPRALFCVGVFTVVICVRD